MTKKSQSDLGLVARGICKSFAAPVLQDVDLTIHRGHIHGLVGENGAGKSTLAKILIGLEMADAGSLYLDGQPYRPINTADSVRKGVALCAQELSLIDDLTIAENILLHNSSSNWVRNKRKHVEENAVRLLELVGLEDLTPRTLVGRLSLAEKQLVEIAKTLGSKAKLLILDEPTSALTAQQADRLHEVLKKLARDRVTFIYISHRLGDVLRICDRISVLRDGQLQLTAESHELTEKTLIWEMVGLDERIDTIPRTAIGSSPRLLSVTGLQTEKLPHPISFHCQRSEILGIAGLDGSGRTELLNAIYGLDKRIAGSVKLHVAGMTAEPRNPRQAIRFGMGLVAEDRAKDGVFADQTLAFNISIAGLKRIANRLGRLIRRRETQAVATLVAALRVRHRNSRQKMRELSGGNQQKSILARWLHSRSQLLLLDEPTRGVDVNAKLAIHAELVRLRDTGVTVIVVSSELDELQSLCDRILVLSNRVLVAEFERNSWRQEDILAAAFSNYVQETKPS
ncbi:MAG: sugar ABC transporter ATP-binding protein [Gammaproteobacteria bacterium]|nr:sugar ABC transporter ATP-binding protein [Gammaproteobacteria bacterium]